MHPGIFATVVGICVLVGTVFVVMYYFGQKTYNKYHRHN